MPHVIHRASRRSTEVSIMKKILIAVSAAFVAFCAAAPASAQGYCPRYYGVPDGPCTGSSTNTPYVRGGAPEYWNNGGYNYQQIPVNPDHPHAPRDGELRYLPNGTAISYVKREHRWVIVSQPTTQPRGVTVTRDVYVAQ